MTRVTDPTVVSRAASHASHRAPILLLVPGVFVLLIAFVVPITLLLSRSVFDQGFTAEHYVRLFAVPQYLEVLGFSLELAAFTTLITLILGYPYAYVLTIAPPVWQATLIAVVLLPFWTNILVRCYSWMLILQAKGLLNTALVDWLGITERSVPMMYNIVGVTVGMVHYLLPPMVLILFSIMRSIDRNLVEAAEGLGASPLRAFWRVFVPLSMPGVRAASVLVFVLSLGFFVTPALLGGRQDVTIAMLIETQINELVNWGFGSALAVVLLSVTVAGLLIYYKVLGRDPATAR
ncbi:MAG TPA: ABC transporter permease [Candidatus Binatia bacterium]|nr:ABC transporter permease [Candidatus Binatia bacterium]